ncbi:hypothetical protein JCM19301_1192 [Jejuia pallidilutea]|uniref:Uncharacterized protein n=1 Tax=Jejuia pallidilutea TaxID=504487 RepID=A0A090VTN7_9FLAO|nr:hypothetical protein JCM19301_1192 [Jejuia pallidilutea]GAL91090.1 hypothetical protein JCM19538_2704 [Jejuia pallidilutea]
MFHTAHAKQGFVMFVESGSFRKIKFIVFTKYTCSAKIYICVKD